MAGAVAAAKKPRTPGGVLARLLVAGLRLVGKGKAWSQNNSDIYTIKLLTVTNWMDRLRWKSPGSFADFGSLNQNNPMLTPMLWEKATRKTEWLKNIQYPNTTCLGLP